MTLARRARYIPFEVIRDDTVTTLDPGGYASSAEFLEQVCSARPPGWHPS
jgi:hypothetical protein